MYDYMAKDESMRIPPEGLVNWHSEGGIRNANVLSHIITLYIPSKTAKKPHIMTYRGQNCQIRFQQKWLN